MTFIFPVASITHGSQNWNRVQWLPFCLLRQSHTIGSSKPLPPKFFVRQKNLTTQFKKEKKKTLTIPMSQKPSPRSPPPPVPIHTCTSFSTLMQGTAYHGGNHLARRLLLPPGCRQTPLHFAMSACRHLPPSNFSTLLMVDPSPPGWVIHRIEVFFSWITR